MSLFIALLGLAFYLAIEPHMRKSWPEMIISWTRLVSGRWSDSLVDHDVLIGLLFGVVSVASLSEPECWRANQSFRYHGAP